jgi:Ca-activated chloride channel homolog
MKSVLYFLFLLLAATYAHGQNAAIAKGNEYYKEGRFDLAEIEYRKGGNDPVAQFNLANALIRQKKGQEALPILGNLSKQKNPGFRAFSYYNAGVVYTQEKDLESAIESYKACLRINPGDRDARENLQKALLELKNEQKQKSQSQSKISMSQADQKLKDLEEKEKNLQKKHQVRQSGQSMENDW